MTITLESYDKINKELVQVLDKYAREDEKEQGMTQYDLLLISSNLVSSVIQAISRVNNVPREELISEAIAIIKTERPESDVSRN